MYMYIFNNITQDFHSLLQTIKKLPKIVEEGLKTSKQWRRLTDEGQPSFPSITIFHLQVTFFSEIVFF